MKRYIAIDLETMKKAGLSMEEWVLLEIVAFCDNGDGCYASRKTMADHIGVSERSIFRIISALVQKGFLEKRGNALMATQKWKKLQTDKMAGNTDKMADDHCQNGRQREIYKREGEKSNKKESLPKRKPKGFEYPEEFEEIWKDYKRGDKWLGYKSWVKCKEDGYTNEEIKKAIEVEKEQKQEQKYWKHLSTLLNGDLDELIKQYDEVVKEEADDDIYLHDLGMTFREAKKRGLL